MERAVLSLDPLRGFSLKGGDGATHAGYIIDSSEVQSTAHITLKIIEGHVNVF